LTASATGDNWGAVSGFDLRSERGLSEAEVAARLARDVVGLRDPVRETVPAAVDECRAAGLSVVMITGDYPETARVAALLVFGYALSRGAPEAEARALTFTTLVGGNLALIATNRSWTRSFLGTVGTTNWPARLIMMLKCRSGAERGHADQGNIAPGQGA
jgi:hypothetical protein